MTMKRASGLMTLLLLACGPSADTPPPPPSPSPARIAERQAEIAEKDWGATLRESFVWGDASQPARDWNVDAEACKKRANEDPGVRTGAHPLVKVGVFAQCMEETGWEFKPENR